MLDRVTWHVRSTTLFVIMHAAPHPVVNTWSILMDEGIFMYPYQVLNNNADTWVSVQKLAHLHSHLQRKHISCTACVFIPNYLFINHFEMLLNVLGTCVLKTLTFLSFSPHEPEEDIPTWSAFLYYPFCKIQYRAHYFFLNRHYITLLACTISLEASPNHNDSVPARSGTCPMPPAAPRSSTPGTGALGTCFSISRIRSRASCTKCCCGCTGRRCWPPRRWQWLASRSSGACGARPPPLSPLGMAATWAPKAVRLTVSLAPGSWH